MKTLLAAVALAATTSLLAQTQSGPAFEVASIKVNAERFGAGPAVSPDRYGRSAISLRDMIAEAYGVQPFEVLGGPDRVAGPPVFDVTATAATRPSPQDMRLMLQRLLTDRFALRVRRETRELPVFILRAARSDGRLGPKLTPTTDDCDAIRAERLRRGEAPPRPATLGNRPDCAWFLSARQTPAGVTLRYRSTGATSREFATWLTRYARRPIVDRTTLPKMVDIDLTFSPAATTPDGSVSLYTALEEQLGLKLESDRAPVEVIVVDSAAMPTPD